MISKTVTPGDWKASIDEASDTWRVYSDSGLVAVCGVGNSPFAEGNANMLAASKDLHLVAEGYVEACWMIDGLIKSIKEHGNYSEDAMVFYLQQINFDMCFAIKALRKAGNKNDNSQQDGFQD